MVTPLIVIFKPAYCHYWPHSSFALAVCFPYVHLATLSWPPFFSHFSTPFLLQCFPMFFQCAASQIGGSASRQTAANRGRPIERGDGNTEERAQDEGGQVEGGQWEAQERGADTTGGEERAAERAAIGWAGEIREIIRSVLSIILRVFRPYLHYMYFVLLREREKERKERCSHCKSRRKSCRKSCSRWDKRDILAVSSVILLYVILQLTIRVFRP